LTGVGVGFHPGEEEDERNPTAGVVFELGTDLVEGGKELDREMDGGDFEGTWIKTVRGWRADQVFAADERADGVDRAGLIDQEGAGYALVEIVEAHALVELGFIAPVFLTHLDEAIDEAGCGEFEQGLVEAFGEFLLS